MDSFFFTGVEITGNIAYCCFCGDVFCNACVRASGSATKVQQMTNAVAHFSSNEINPRSDYLSMSECIRCHAKQPRNLSKRQIKALGSRSKRGDAWASLILSRMQPVKPPERQITSCRARAGQHARPSHKHCKACVTHAHAPPPRVCTCLHDFRLVEFSHQPVPVQ
jgi:hypothetical protein